MKLQRNGQAGLRPRLFLFLLAVLGIALFAGSRLTLASVETPNNSQFVLADSAMVPVPKPMPDSATAPPRSESAPPVPAVKSGITTFILVRHAERDTFFAGTDQPLSQTGKMRAYDLQRVLKDVPIDAVYTTKWTRTKQTAGPFMSTRRDTAFILEGSDFKAQAAMLKAKHVGQTVLIVGHSDSVPQIIQNMINSPISQLGHLEYDALWVVSIAPDGKGTALKLRYGSGPK